MARVKRKGSGVDSFSVNFLTRDRDTFDRNFFAKVCQLCKTILFYKKWPIYGDSTLVLVR